MRRFIGVLVGFFGAQIGKHGIADVFKNKSLAAVARNNPTTLRNLHGNHLVSIQG
jgi:hypothetical protein